MHPSLERVGFLAAAASAALSSITAKPSPVFVPYNYSANHYARVVGGAHIVNAPFGDDITSWLSAQVPFSQVKMLGNIHPDGSLPGTVVAATSKLDPPYYFHWTRE